MSLNLIHPPVKYWLEYWPPVRDLPRSLTPYSWCLDNQSFSALTLCRKRIGSSSDLLKLVWILIYYDRLCPWLELLPLTINTSPDILSEDLLSFPLNSSRQEENSKESTPCPPPRSSHSRWPNLQEALCSISCVLQLRFLSSIRSDKVSSSGASGSQCFLSGTCSLGSLISSLRNLGHHMILYILC